ncbi:LysR family transcriptional regulator [Sinorhizobium fredii]|uniref:LysR family transcriptional regulator n=1 Tax=Rhizobium fredii TaxID=380 RepID=A0A2A6LP95_RHIFR|nr:LysR family transcriptional regulator [Sinorhizobium fredii]PDT44503.1 LysR family transcriptional regulator [Sinorhizobium fredii]WOS65885.1 LysR family transcriptional regulator [Sinorhizobium fredii GR64]
MFSLRSVEVFYWAGRLRSFSKAAEKLNTTQPTISQRIGAMEEAIGEHLFDRLAKPIALTRVGRTLFDHAELLLRQVASMERDLEVNRHGHCRVRLGVSETIVQTWLSRFLEQASRRFPNMDFDMTVDVTPSMLVALQNGEIDIALMLGPGVLEGFTCVKLKDYPLQFYAIPGLVPGELLTYQKASTVPILTYPRNTYPFNYLRELVFKKTGRPPRIFANSSISTIEKLALDGIGIALVAEGTLGAARVDNILQPVRSEIDLPPLRFYAFYPLGFGSEMLEELAAIAQRVASEDSAAE